MKHYNWIIIVLALALLGLIYENDRKVEKAYQKGYEDALLNLDTINIKETWKEN